MGVGEARAHHDMVLRLCLYIGACRCAVIHVRVQDASNMVTAARRRACALAVDLRRFMSWR